MNTQTKNMPNNIRTAQQAAALLTGICFADRPECGICVIDTTATPTNSEELALSVVSKELSLHQKLLYTHDCNGAPFVYNTETGSEVPLLISVSDEDELLCLTWAMETSANTPDSTQISGIGIDLASRGCYTNLLDEEQVLRHMFFDSELTWVHEHFSDDLDQGLTLLLSVKEAAFKSAACAAHRAGLKAPEDVYFEFRGLEVVPDKEAPVQTECLTFTAKGTNHAGDSVTGLLKAGISQILVHTVYYDKGVLALAQAY